MYEYKIVPAPKKGLKAKGLKSAEDRFANTLSELMNREARGGWEFLRAETLPSEERAGFRSSTTVYRSLLVFRKARQETADDPVLPEIPAPTAPSVAPVQPPATPQPVIAGEDTTADDGLSEADDQDSSSARA